MLPIHCKFHALPQEVNIAQLPKLPLPIIPVGSQVVANCTGLEPCPYGQKPNAEFAFDGEFFDNQSDEDEKLAEPSPTETPTLEITIAPTEVATVEASATPMPTLPPETLETAIPSPEPSPTPAGSEMLPTP